MAMLSNPVFMPHWIRAELEDPDVVLIADPRFDEADPNAPRGDWRVQIPFAVAEHWAALSYEARAIAYLMACAQVQTEAEQAEAALALAAV